MAKLVYELNQSLDGYVDHDKMGPPRPALFRHFIERVRGLAGMIYGRGMYEVMRYWDDDRPDWDAEKRDYAAVWRAPPQGGGSPPPQWVWPPPPTPAGHAGGASR